MKLKTIKIKRLWHGLASVRDYIIADCVKKSIGMRVKYDGVSMEFSADEVKDCTFKLSERDFKSRFDGKRYKLIDFMFHKKKITPHRRKKGVVKVQEEEWCQTLDTLVHKMMHVVNEFGDLRDVKLLKDFASQTHYVKSTFRKCVEKAKIQNDYQRTGLDQGGL